MSSQEQHQTDKGTPADTSESFLKQCEKQQLVMMLHTAQARIGTGTETPHDMERVVAIAHRLNNIYTAQKLAAALADDERLTNNAS